MRTGMACVGRLLAALVMSVLCGGMASAAHPQVLVLHNAFVSAEKFQRLAPIAQANGLTLRAVDVDSIAPADLRQAVAQADLVLLDTPRPNDRTAVQARSAQALAAEPQRMQLTVGGGPPAWDNLAPRLGGPMTAHYAAGGRSGFERFFALAAAVLAGEAPRAGLMAAATRLPPTGFYHPRAPHVFTDLAAYLRWQRDTRPAAAAAAAPPRPAHGRVALLISSSTVADLLTRPVDELVQRLESAGLQPVVFWFDGEAPGGLAAVLRGGDIDALVNMTHLQNGAARTQDFRALDIPVLQTLRFREGEAGDWLAAPTGVAARTTAVFLAGPEAWGVVDPVVVSAARAGVEALLPAQADALVAKLRRLVALRHTPPADKRLALMFWNYPAGEKNLGASHLNLPRSLVSIQAALAQAGYDVGPSVTPEEVVAAGQRMLGAVYGTVPLDVLLQEGLAATFPVADYERWLATLPPVRQAELRHAGRPDEHPAVRTIEGQRVFIIPRWRLGQWVILPQPPRQGEGHGHYHDTASVPDHRYLAAYLYLRQGHDAHALIHLGTHGTQEWLPGKDRGLAASDYPWLAAGDLPIFYPYIQDNVGEAIQARRRGRAVTISHQTPPFAPAGLYDQLRDLHHAIHEVELADEGGVREQALARVQALAQEGGMLADLGWTEAAAKADPPGLVRVLHDHLHELARTAMPLGLHTFGVPAEPDHRVATIMQQLGAPFEAALGVDDEALLVDGPEALASSPAFIAVQALLGGEGSHAQTETPTDPEGKVTAGSEGNAPPGATVMAEADANVNVNANANANSNANANTNANASANADADAARDADIDNPGTPAALPPPSRAQPPSLAAPSPLARPLPPAVLAFADRARALARHRVDTQELESLLAGLQGRLVPPGSGGDPIRNPDVASGRNLYAFEPDKIPARAAFDAAAIAYDQLVQAFRAEHAGQWPDKLAFSLWSSETIRHLGVTEGQILHALGLTPVWDAGGRVTRLDIVPMAALGRPRTDVVVQVTGVYRDQFDGFMRLLDDALARLAALDEPGNPIGANNARVAQALMTQGMPAEAATAAASHRIFGQAPGEYGTGVPDLALRSTEWEDDAVLGQQFLRSSRFAYGKASWGESPAAANVLAEQLRGTQAAVLARSSNLQGVLSSDHPFEFLGGLSAAIQVVDGKAPQLLVSDLRRADVRTTGLDRFLADEMRTRYLNPQWIAGMQAEGYAGTLEVLHATNNLFGWQAVDAATVRADQWQALFDTYVTDTRELGTAAWFEQHHPTAQAQILERMAEAIRKDYWDAPQDTRDALARRWDTLVQEHGVDTGAPVTRAFIAQMAQAAAQAGTAAPDSAPAASGFGLDAGAPAIEAAHAAAALPESAGAAPAPGGDSPQPDPDAATPTDAVREPVHGQVLEPVPAPAASDSPSLAGLLAVLALLLGAGAWRQHRAARRLFPSPLPGP